MIRYIIALKELGINNSNLITLLESYSSDIKKMFTDDSIFETSLEIMACREYFSNQKEVKESLVKADRILEKSKKLEIKVTYYTDRNYPKELSQIANPPAVIYYKGANFCEISENSIACVGTRKPTKLSYNAINYLVPQWVNNGCSIISGLACGVDKLSHQSCISAGGKTVAVLAHWLDTISPKENRDLANRILLNGGILMSEYPVGTKVDKFRFVNRNRIIVGMSKAIVIYECDEKGGTMHNVEFACQQDKTIFCPKLGNEILDIQTGTKKLIDEHIATVINQGRDIKKVLDVVGVKNINSKMTNIEIKKIYLRAVLAIINSEEVIEISIKELGLPIRKDSSFCEKIMKLINDDVVDIDILLNSLILNNIASINKT